MVVTWFTSHNRALKARRKASLTYNNVRINIEPPFRDAIPKRKTNGTEESIYTDSFLNSAYSHISGVLFCSNPCNFRDPFKIGSDFNFY
jgi:hypothetical protein